MPLFVSRARLTGRRSFPRAVQPWALDSGGFTQLQQHGCWTVPARTYVAEVRRYAREVGRLEWAAIQDWMCEPWILRRTGLTVAEHQRRTVQSYLELKLAAPELPWAPVLQGWTWGDYLDHFELYERAGIDLRAAPVVGLGSICRRQHTMRASFIVQDLADEGLRLHGFGFKLTGLRVCREHLVSADSMAWSFHARRERNGMQNSLKFAVEWLREHVDPNAPAYEPQAREPSSQTSFSWSAGAAVDQ